jgi:hypothetical protein
VIASKCVSLSLPSERWHCYAKRTNLAFSFDIVDFRAPVCRIHPLLFLLQSHDLWITTCLSRFFLPLHALMCCVRIILKYPRQVPVGATERVSSCLTGMDEVFVNCDCVLILLLCATVWNVLNADVPLSKIFIQNLSPG